MYSPYHRNDTLYKASRYHSSDSLHHCEATEKYNRVVCNYLVNVYVMTVKVARERAITIL